jgi:hypothetical protein
VASEQHAIKSCCINNGFNSAIAYGITQVKYASLYRFVAANANMTAATRTLEPPPPYTATASPISSGRSSEDNDRFSFLKTFDTGKHTVEL